MTTYLVFYCDKYKNQPEIEQKEDLKAAMSFYNEMVNITIHPFPLGVVKSYRFGYKIIGVNSRLVVDQIHQEIKSIMDKSLHTVQI